LKSEVLDEPRCADAGKQTRIRTEQKKAGQEDNGKKFKK
jgi:hypothetical protein